jgi:hypothetical protein
MFGAAIYPWVQTKSILGLVKPGDWGEQRFLFLLWGKISHRRVNLMIQKDRQTPLT